MVGGGEGGGWCVVFGVMRGGVRHAWSARAGGSEGGHTEEASGVLLRVVSPMGNGPYDNHLRDEDLPKEEGCGREERSRWGESTLIDLFCT